jgi:putative chitinase
VSAGILKAGGKIRNEALVAAGLPSLNREMRNAGISTPRRIAAFLSTLAVESEFEYNRPQDGDTRLYAGRGYIQLTGAGNYGDAGKYLGIDLLGHPELALSLEWSAKIATWYWTKARPSTNAYADALRMGMVNKMIGFPEGTGDNVRCRMFGEALRVLTGEIPDGISCARS